MVSGHVALEISKPGFLNHQNIKPASGNKINTVNIAMWPGDIPCANGQDNSINMADIMAIASSFNKAEGSPEYNSYCDFNGDKVINMSDIMLAAEHFNSISSNYPTGILPTVEIIYPLDGTKVNRDLDKLLLNIEGNNNSGSGIKCVDFCIGDKLLHTDSELPYQMPLNLLKDYSGSVTVRATVITDAGDSVETSVSFE
jgi:hypothetical protein